jgi:hypothetical protein
MSTRKSGIIAEGGRLLVFGVLWLCGSIGLVAAPKPLLIEPSDLKLEGDLGPFKASWSTQRPEANLLLATLTLTAQQPAPPPPLSVKWSFPSVDFCRYLGIGQQQVQQ